MTRQQPTQQELGFLRSIDTPTVCNLIEIVAPERRGSGYTVKHLHCPFPELPAMVGFAGPETVTECPTSRPPWIMINAAPSPFIRASRSFVSIASIC